MADDPVKPAISVEARLRSNIAKLLANVGDKGQCRGCGAEIWWITHNKSGKKVPYTPEGLNHFADCPAAAQFKKPKEPGEHQV
jgi:hypothetical protein